MVRPHMLEKEQFTIRSAVPFKFTQIPSEITLLGFFHLQTGGAEAVLNYEKYKKSSDENQKREISCNFFQTQTFRSIFHIHLFDFYVTVVGKDENAGNEHGEAVQPEGVINFELSDVFHFSGTCRHNIQHGKCVVPFFSR